MNKIKEWAGLVALVAIILMSVLGGGNAPLAGTTNYDHVDTTDGYAVDGTDVINTSGTWISAITAAAAAQFDSTVLFSSNFASSSIGAATMTAANLTGKSSILHNAASALTLTLPATSTLSSFVPSTGDRASVTFVNIGAGAITFAAGAGMILSNASTTLALPPTSAAQFEFVRQADTDIHVLYIPGS